MFRVDTENRQRRIEMNQIAIINIKNGEVKPHGDRTLTVQDIAKIESWMNKGVTPTNTADPAPRPSLTSRAPSA